MKEPAAPQAAFPPTPPRPPSRPSGYRRRPLKTSQPLRKEQSFATCTASEIPVPRSPELEDGVHQSLHDIEGCQHASVTLGNDPCAEIRTKVFRIGAPLLRSTIPVSMGNPPHETQGLTGEEDVETVLSLSDVEFEDQGSLVVTLDFPC